MKIIKLRSQQIIAGEIRQPTEGAISVSDAKADELIKHRHAVEVEPEGEATETPAPKTKARRVKAAKPRKPKPAPASPVVEEAAAPSVDA